MQKVQIFFGLRMKLSEIFLIGSDKSGERKREWKRKEKERKKRKERKKENKISKEGK